MSLMSDRGSGPSQHLEGRPDTLKGDAISANLHTLGPVTKCYRKGAAISATCFSDQIEMFNLC